MFSTCLALWVFKLPETKSLHVEQMGDELYVQPRAGPAAAPSLSWSGRRWCVLLPCPSLVQWAGQKGWHPAGSGCVPASNGEKMYGWILNGEGDMRKKGSDFFFPSLSWYVKSGTVFTEVQQIEGDHLQRNKANASLFFLNLKPALEILWKTLLSWGEKIKVTGDMKASLFSPNFVCQHIRMHKNLTSLLRHYIHTMSLGEGKKKM